MSKIFNLYVSGYTTKSRELKSFIFVEKCKSLDFDNNSNRIGELLALFVTTSFIDPKTLSLIYTTSDECVAVDENKMAVAYNTGNNQIIKIKIDSRESRYMLISNTFEEYNGCRTMFRYDKSISNSSKKIHFYNTVIHKLMSNMYTCATGNAPGGCIDYNAIKQKLIISYCYADPNNNSVDIDRGVYYDSILPNNYTPTLLEKIIGFFYDSGK